MKIKLLSQNIKFYLELYFKMLNNLSDNDSQKNNFWIIFFGFFGACGAPTAMLGPAYTHSLLQESIAQAGFSYGSNA